MSISFFWHEESGVLVPNCCSDVIAGDGVDILSCLLTDSGGQGYDSIISWLDEGLFRVRLVREGGVNISDWSRDSWGVELAENMAKIYSLYDEDFFAVIGLDDFEKALSGWRAFVERGKTEQ